MPQFRPKLPNLGQRPSADEAETAWRVDPGETEGRPNTPPDEALAGLTADSFHGACNLYEIGAPAMHEMMKAMRAAGPKV